MERMAILQSVCVVHALHPDAGGVGVTAIDKRPVDGPVKVRKLGLYGDVQADRHFHGGPNQAVYAYAQENADHWKAELGRELPAGWFGENLRTEGLDVTGARIGEQWQFGTSAFAVVLEVTAPRTPCQTFARWVGGEHTPDWVERFTAHGHPGAYLKVVRPGSITAGDQIQLVRERPDAPTIGQVFRTP